MEIRPIEPDELPEFGRIASASLGRSSGTFDALRAEWTLAAFEEGAMVATYGMWPLTMRLNGEGIPIAGVTAVSTFPIYRRRGYVRAITEHHFRSLHDQKERPIAVLNASMAAIYHRYGYAVCSTQHSYRFEPRFLQFPHPIAVPGDFREARDDEFPLLVDLYRQFRAERTGYVHRGRAMWEAGVLSPPIKEGHLSTLVYQEAGKPLGYLIYSVDPIAGEPGFARLQVTVRDLVWLSPSMYQAAWQHLRNLDLADMIVWGHVPEDDPLPHILAEPRMLNVAVRDGIMGRIVDVEAALPLRPYAAEGTLVFDLQDDLCTWNTGRWKMQTTGLETTITRTKEQPELSLPVTTLAALTFGYFNATQAARMGKLDTYENDALIRWDAVMRTSYRPACSDIF
ncbi:MAG: hypothetical protein BZY82_07930 [SAR202 cluster bacterium Io17-Chloro-G3]|nr:MAG: hypothetical protein BZY82_07930 [SAR202 cluster bacterium Io17-Chloro-G3]